MTILPPEVIAEIDTRFGTDGLTSKQDATELAGIAYLAGQRDGRLEGIRGCRRYGYNMTNEEVSASMEKTEAAFPNAFKERDHE